MIRDDQEHGFDHDADNQAHDLGNRNLELPLEDDLPF